MKIIKRSGTEVNFDIAKIMAAVTKANNEVVHNERLSDEKIEIISRNVENICNKHGIYKIALSKQALASFHSSNLDLDKYLNIAFSDKRLEVLLYK